MLKNSKLNIKDFIIKSKLNCCSVYMLLNVIIFLDTIDDNNTNKFNLNE